MTATDNVQDFFPPCALNLTVRFEKAEVEKTSFNWLSFLKGGNRATKLPCSALSSYHV